jgi:small-conductance mechanosensitive channel
MDFWHRIAVFLANFASDQKVFLTNLIWSLVVWIVAVLILRIIRAFIGRVLHNRQVRLRLMDDRRAKTLVTILNSIARYTIYFLAIITILDKFGLPVTSFLTAAGIGGVALAFGAQSLVRDIITGFFLIFEDQYAVGDLITIAGVTGTVEEMTLRVTKVRDAGGQLHIIPNGKVEQVTNHMGSSMRAMIDVPVAIDTDLNQAEEVLKGVFQQFVKDFPDLVEAPKLLGVESISRREMILRILARTPAMAQWDVERELRKRIKIAFDQSGINTIPKVILLQRMAGKGRRQK